MEKYKIRQNSQDQEIGVLLSTDTGILKVGGNKSNWREMAYVYRTLMGMGEGEEIPSPVFVGNGKCTYRSIARGPMPFGGRDIETFDARIESLKALGWLVSKTNKLGRIMR